MYIHFALFGIECRRMLHMVGRPSALSFTSATFCESSQSWTMLCCGDHSLVCECVCMSFHPRLPFCDHTIKWTPVELTLYYYLFPWNQIHSYLCRSTRWVSKVPPSLCGNGLISRVVV